jgi:MFS transporter, SP family, xylose:H+ symportor
MSHKTIYYSIIASLSGFLFGFDTVVISGANLPIKELWKNSEWFHGLTIMSVALWGTLLGAVLGNIPCDRFGRKNTLFWIGVLYFVSAIGTALATDPYIFSVYRFLGGLAIGTATIAAPTYITEIAPYQYRGKLVGLFQINIVVGILSAYLSNYFLTGFGGSNDWRFMLGVEAIPALLFLVLVSSIPESPRWLIINKNQVEKGLAILTRLFDGGSTSPRHILQNIRNEQLDFKAAAPTFRKTNYAFSLAFFMAFFNQVSGINFVLYYAPEIMEKAGFATEESLLGTVFIGGTNLIFTLFGISLIDKMGRKHLMMIGSLGYLISLSMISYGFYSLSSPGFSLVGFLLFIAAHAVGQGSVLWVFVAEIFPNRLRAKGQSFGAGIHWAMAAIITLAGPYLITYIPVWQIFAIFLTFMGVQFLWVIFWMPETKGKPLETMLLKSQLHK